MPADVCCAPCATSGNPYMRPQAGNRPDVVNEAPCTPMYQTPFPDEGRRLWVCRWPAEGPACRHTR